MCKFTFQHYFMFAVLEEEGVPLVEKEEDMKEDVAREAQSVDRAVETGNLRVGHGVGTAGLGVESEGQGAGSEGG